MPKRIHTPFLIFTFLSWLIFLPFGAESAELQHTQTPYRHGVIHVFSFSPKDYALRLYPAPSKDMPLYLALLNPKTLHTPLIFNSGFFSKHYRPMGLRISNGVLHNTARNVHWWGIFSQLKNGTVHLSRHLSQTTPWPDFAIQSGPVLFGNTGLKAHPEERTVLALCQNKVKVLLTDKAPLPFSFLKQFLKDKEHCQQALALDGGHSTQFAWQAKGHIHRTLRPWPIAEAIYLQPR